MDKKEQFNNLVKNKLSTKSFLIICIFLFIVFIIGLAYLIHLKSETWINYGSKLLNTMTQEEKEKLVYDYMVDKYGVEVNVNSFGLPGGTDAFDRFYNTAVIATKTSIDPQETYCVYVKNNGKMCDTYFLNEAQDDITDYIKDDLVELKYEHCLKSYTYIPRPYYPTFEMEYLAKHNPIKLFLSEKTYTSIDVYILENDIDNVSEIKDFIEQKTEDYTNVQVGIIVVDDLNSIDFSLSNKTVVNAFYKGSNKK